MKSFQPTQNVGEPFFFWRHRHCEIRSTPVMNHMDSSLGIITYYYLIYRLYSRKKIKITWSTKNLTRSLYRKNRKWLSTFHNATYNRQISDIEIPPEGRGVHLRQYGFIKVFRVVHSDGDAEHWATDILDASEPDRKSFKELGWNIEVYHRGIKQCCGIERCQGRKEIVQRGHIFLSLLAFLRLETQRLNTGISWYESKRLITRTATSLFISKPTF